MDTTFSGVAMGILEEKGFKSFYYNTALHLVGVGRQVITLLEKLSYIGICLIHLCVCINFIGY